MILFAIKQFGAVDQGSFMGIEDFEVSHFIAAWSVCLILANIVSIFIR